MEPDSPLCAGAVQPGNHPMPPANAAEPDTRAPGRDWRTGLICLGLALATVAAFSGLVHAEFIKFDDRQYVTDNPHVTSGLTWANVKWAFTTGYASNWHPLTWISHMCDVQLFGLRPGGHHLVNVLLHAANTVLLFLLLRYLTGRIGASAIVAALFGLHPLHVESVAWVAERKDVLSTLFFLLTIWAYARYARACAPVAAEPGLWVGSGELAGSPTAAPNLGRGTRVGFYSLALALFASGLMSKPMLVTLPCLLCLLDWWPLGRLTRVSNVPGSLRSLILEKIPFFGLTAASSVVTYLAQAGSHSVTTGLPFRMRATNAVVSYLKYVGKVLWPSKLAIFYPHPDTRYGLPASPGYPASEQWPPWLVLLGFLVLVAVSGWALVGARRRPWLFTGWFWYLGMLVPVIGLVQVGMQSLADRYSYVPSIGLLLAAVWGAAELGERSALARKALMPIALGVVVACFVATHQQTGFWRNNAVLFEHALAVTRHNAVAECNVGEDLAQQGKLALAQGHFRAAQKDDPRNPLAYLDLGIAFELEGKPDQALPQYQATVKLRPWSVPARLRLAGVLAALNQREDALVQYREALKLEPRQAQVHYELGKLLAAQGKIPDALSHFHQALELKPDFSDALVQAGTLLAAQGRFAEAQPAFREAVGLCPTNAALRLELGKVLKLQGKNAEAAPEFAEALRLRPSLPDELLQEGQRLAREHQFNAALVRFNTALWLEPDSVVALTELAWMLATHPLAQLRNGTRALRLAQRALQLSSGTDPRAWAALDAAYAESGRFSEAIAAAEKARQFALSAGDPQAAEACESRLTLYRAQHAYHQ